MKNLFPGHFKESDENLKKVWDTCLFVFDANILLNFYRYSDTTRKEFLSLLDKIRARVWLPHRAAEEYLSNRLTVIDHQEKLYDETMKSISTLKTGLDNARQHPFVSSNTMSKANKIFDSLLTELQENKEIHTKRISSDEIKDSILKIFEKSVGKPYEKEKLEKIISDGEERYKQKIPPGFKDSNKSSGSEIFTERCKKFGDLIVWHQVIDKSMESKKSIIFVTDDKKEDWWEIFKGKTVGPRPELVEEFITRTKNTFYMYQADRFLELAREYLNESVNNEIIEEIREVRRLDNLAYKKEIKEIEFYKSRETKLSQLKNEIDIVHHEVLNYEKEMQNLQIKRRLLDSERDKLKDYRNRIIIEGESDIESNEQLANHYALITREYESVSHHLDMLRMKHQKTKRHKALLEQELSNNMKFLEQGNIGYW